MPSWKKYVRIISPHVGLILLSLLYVVGGALTFYQLERPNEIAVRRYNLRQIDAHKRYMLEELRVALNDDAVSNAELKKLALQHVDNVTRVLFEAFDTHYISASHLRQKIASDPTNDNHNGAVAGGEGEHELEEEYSWTFTTALFFTATLLTTIGYGNLVPVTFEGRMFCVLYALFGVPLILITVADIGKFLSENIVWLYGKYESAKRRYNQKLNLNGTQPIDDQTTSPNDQFLQFGLEQVISIPILLIVGMLLGYITAGAILLATWEHWDFFSGFYFSFITMTTVGFGDIVPLKHEYFLIDLFYIVVGLAITTMCIDLVGIQYIRKIHYFGRAIRDARYALVNVRGRMVHVPDLMRYAYVLHQKYGQKRRNRHEKGAYAPEDILMIRYIDYGSMASESSHSCYFANASARNRSEESSIV